MYEEVGIKAAIRRLEELRDIHKEYSDKAIAYQTAIEILHEECMKLKFKKERSG